MSDIVTQLLWKRTSELIPWPDKWLLGLFVSEKGSRIRECQLRVLSGPLVWFDGEGYRCETPLLWSNPEDVIQGLMEVIDGNGVNHDTR